MIELTVEEIATLTRARDVLHSKLIPGKSEHRVVQARDYINDVLGHSTLKLGTLP